MTRRGHTPILREKAQAPRDRELLACNPGGSLPPLPRADRRVIFSVLGEWFVEFE